MASRERRQPGQRNGGGAEGAGLRTLPHRLLLCRSPSTAPSRPHTGNRYGSFINVGSIPRHAGPPDADHRGAQRAEHDSSDLLRLFNRQCIFDAQVHFGECEDPQDFAQGYVWARIYEGIEPSGWGGADQGTFDEGGDGVSADTLDVTAQRIYDIKRLRGAEVAATTIASLAVDAVIADQIATCGQCGRVSDGTQIALILEGSSAGSPGVPARLLADTQDGTNTWGVTTVDTLGVGEAASKMAVVGPNVVVVSQASGSLHYASLIDILDGTETWAAVTTGFDGSGQPNAITTVARDRTWIAGQGGRVYLAEDPTSLVVEQADGSQTSQNLTAIHAFDRNNVVAVGASNAVVVTANGGATWALVVGPAVGVALTSIWMRSANEWLVGSAGGRLYYTQNAGSTWTEKGFAGSGTGVVRDIKFASRNVGYMSHSTVTPLGRLFRTIDGGNSWVVMPEEQGQTIPANDYLAAIAPSIDDVNFVLAVGLNDNATDGFAVLFN